MSLDIRLKRVDRVFREGEKLAGVVVVTSQGDVSHSGITLTIEGSVNLQLSAKSVGMFEAFYNSIKPVQLIFSQFEVAPPGKLPSGTTEMPFEFPLKGKDGQQLYETYHGVFVNIQYSVRADMARSFLNGRNMSKVVEFIVENEPSEKLKIVEVPFSITPETLENVKKASNVPNFKITGKLHSATCSVTEPFTGELVVEHVDAKIKSIELQLVRVETCGSADGYARDATEIQNIQISEGDVCRGLTIPMHMIFPRLFTCPTLAAKNFKVEFEVNLVVLLQDGYLITENFPIRLIRVT